MSNSRGTLLVRSYLCTRYYFLIIIVLLGSNVILFNIPGMRPAICRGSKSRSLGTHIWWRILGCFLSDMEALLSKYLRSSMHVCWLDDKFSWTKINSLLRLLYSNTIHWRCRYSSKKEFSTVQVLMKGPGSAVHRIKTYWNEVINIKYLLV